ncbi:MAG: hypothetical protein ABR562_08000 [Thermoplasmatota archaeon]
MTIERLAGLCYGKPDMDSLIATDTNTAYAKCISCGKGLEFCYPGEWDHTEEADRHLLKSEVADRV